MKCEEVCVVWSWICDSEQRRSQTPPSITNHRSLPPSLSWCSSMTQDYSHVASLQEQFRASGALKLRPAGGAVKFIPRSPATPVGDGGVTAASRPKPGASGCTAGESIPLCNPTRELPRLSINLTISLMTYRRLVTLSVEGHAPPVSVVYYPHTTLRSLSTG